MSRNNRAREKCVRWVAAATARWHGLGSGSREASEIERLAGLFASEGMGAFEAVDAAAVLVLKKYARAGAI